MGTRGFIGFVVDGVEKIAYNHWDSYPSGKGVQVLEWLHAQAADHLAMGLEGTRLRASLAQVVTDETTPITAEVLEKCARWTNRDVGARVTADGLDTSVNWYQLLRETQGDVEAILEAGYIEDASDFPYDSLFCEWGYLIDFDRQNFEVYKGFQNSPPTSGRWSTPERIEREAEMYRDYLVRSPRAVGEERFFAVNRVAFWSLNDLPSVADVLALEEVQEQSA